MVDSVGRKGLTGPVAVGGPEKGGHSVRRGRDRPCPLACPSPPLCLEGWVGVFVAETADSQKHGVAGRNEGMMGRSTSLGPASEIQGFL